MNDNLFNADNWVGESPNYYVTIESAEELPDGKLRLNFSKIEKPPVSISFRPLSEILNDKTGAQMEQKLLEQPKCNHLEWVDSLVLKTPIKQKLSFYVTNEGAKKLNEGNTRKRLATAKRLIKSMGYKCTFIEQIETRIEDGKHYFEFTYYPFSVR